MVATEEAVRTEERAYAPQQPVAARTTVLPRVEDRDLWAAILGILLVLSPLFYEWWIEDMEIGRVHFHALNGLWVIPVIAGSIIMLAAVVGTRTRWPRKLGVVMIFVLGLVIAASSDIHDAKATAGDGTECGRDTYFDKSKGECRSLDAIVMQDALKDGWKPGELRSGDDVQFEGAPQERGSAAFTKETLESRADIRAFLNSDRPAAEAARARLKSVLSERDYQRALKGEGFYPLQYKLAAQYEGTTYFSGGEIVTMNSLRQVEKNDVVWLYVTEDGKVVRDASIRADCANPSFKKVIPVRPTTPKQPPIERPPPKQPPPEVRDKKCFNADGSLKDPDGDGICSPTPRSGPEQNPRSDPGRTPGYTRGNAERAAGSEQTWTDQNSRPPPDNTTYDSGGGAGSSPSGGYSGPNGDQNGSTEGTTDNESNNTSGQTSGSGSDPCANNPDSCW